MARQVLPIVGAVVGAYFGNPQLGYAIGSIIGNAVDPQVIEGPALGEGQVNTAREGGYRPIVLGTGCVGCNIINVGPEKIRTHRERQSKGGGPVSETKRRYRTFALRICEGPIAGLLRIWQGEKLVYDVRPESVIPEDSAKYAEGFTFYLGDETQLPDPDLEAYLGAGNVNAYRGTAYIVFTNFDLTDTQGAIPNFRFEVFTELEAPTATTAVLLGETPPDTPASTYSADGITWSAADPMSDSDILNYITSTSTRHVQWSSSELRYSDDNGATWINPGHFLGGIGGQHQSYIIGDTILIPRVADGMFRSTDGGETLTLVSGILSKNVALRNGFGISVTTFESNCSITVSDGLTWTEGGDPPIYSQLDKYIACNESCFLLGGRTGNVDSKPKIARTVNGNIWTSVTLGASAGEYVMFLCPGEPEHWVALIDNGEIWFSEDDGESFVQAVDSLSRTPTGICYNGDRFIASSGPSGPGTVKTSENKNNWSLRSQPLTSLTSLLSCLQNPQQVLTPGKIPLSSIVSFIHERCGHTAGQYSVAELTDQVDGVVFADSYTGSDAIRTIIPIYFADASEHDAGSGYKINYIKRGKPVVRTLVLDDLVDEPEEAVRQDSLERAAKFHLHFQNPTIGYAAAKATSSRSSPDVTSNVTGEISVQVPITFADVNEAAQRSNILHKVSWVEVAGTQEIMISDADMDLVPTDVIGLYLRGILTRYRMVTQQYVDGTLKCEFMADRQSAYTSNVTGIPLPDPEPPPSSIVGPTVSVFGDWPALVDGHDALIAYAAATGQTSAWWGATYQRSLDAGANYTTAATFDDFNTIMGVLQEVLPDASEHYTDTTNSVRVTLYTDDQIESLTQQQFLSEGGGFALSWENSEGTQWEMLQYRDAEQDSNGDWILSHLLRGRLDTETAEHPPGATFVLLDNSLKVMPMQSAWLGMELTHRAYSNGETPESAVPYDDEFTGKSQREWPVANLLLDRDGDDIEATAIPRHRFGTDDAPVQSVNHSGYRWTATDGVNTVNIDTVVPTQIFDATGWGSPVTVTVAQLNRITGAGPSVSEDIV